MNRARCHYKESFLTITVSAIFDPESASKFPLLSEQNLLIYLL